MNLHNEQLLTAIRLIAWERAKGDLRAVIASFAFEDEATYQECRTLIEEFIVTAGEGVMS